MILNFINLHPLMCTILGLPVVITGCILILGFCNVKFTWNKS